MIALLSLGLAFTLLGCNQNDPESDSDSYPAAQLKKSPGIFDGESLGMSCAITAPDYYGDAVVGETFMFAVEALWEHDPARPTDAPGQNSDKHSKTDPGYRYPIFITADGTLELKTVFKEGDGAEFQIAVYKTEQIGNDVIFTPGTPAKRDRESTQIVSGIFAIETLSIYPNGTVESSAAANKQYSKLWGIVLSQKQVDEFFATGRIAHYRGFDFSGLNDLGLDSDETDTTTTKPDTMPVQKTPDVYKRDSFGDGEFVITAPDYYGEVALGETYTVEESALSATGAVGGFKASKEDAYFAYMLFITQDGTLDIKFAFEKGDENTDAEYQSAVFKTERDGNDVIFKTGIPVDQSNEFTQKVSGIFAVEVMGVRTIDGTHSTTNDMLWGIVLSQKEADEFFATEQIANYSDFDFSGLSEVVSAQ